MAIVHKHAETGRYYISSNVFQWGSYKGYLDSSVALCDWCNDTGEMYLCSGEYGVCSECTPEERRERHVYQVMLEKAYKMQGGES